MNAETFLDTNILIYAFTTGDPRCAIADTLLAAGGTISVQVLNEFAAVARRKLGMSWTETADALDAVRTLCPGIVPVTVDVHSAGLEIAAHTGFRIYDALIVAAALQAGCTTLLSEDLQHGRVVAGTLTVRNPFTS